jgi:m7GpppX diphosphatase
MKFHKIEILEIKKDTNVYYGNIDKIDAILIGDKEISEEILLNGEIILKNENFQKIKLVNSESIIHLYYPATTEMIESYKSKMKIITESYDDYKNKIEPYINSILESNTKWIKNILNLQNEANKILFKGEKFIVVKNIGYDTKNDFYLLAIPYEPLKNIRDLEPKHRELLKLMKLKTLEIAKKHNFDEEDLYFFFHYHPSCYHLHLHICLNTHKNLKFKIYRHVLLEDVMENIEKIGKKTMKFEISISNPIYKLLTST